MITSHQRRHLLLYKNNEWIYADDGSSIEIERPCIRCGKMPTSEGFDACTGYVEGFSSYCCGHGVAKPIAIPKGEIDEAE